MLRVISAHVKTSKKDITYEFSSVQFNMPFSLSEKIKKWGKTHIIEKDLYKEEQKYGRENEIHVTIKYGLHTSRYKSVARLVKDFGSFEITLGEITRFVPKDKDYDVVKIDIKGDSLHDLNKIIGELKNSDEHPEYRPHCTIAYVKKGHCSELSGNTDLKGLKAKVEELVFSSKDGRDYVIKL